MARVILSRETQANISVRRKTLMLHDFPISGGSIPKVLGRVLHKTNLYPLWA